MKPLDLSVDLGEATNDAERAVEDQIWPLITSANVACGGHVGDDDSMMRAIEKARSLGVQLGAHPSYPDRENFGRRTMQIDAERLRDSLVQQLSSLAALAEREGIALCHVKPHGALYNDAHARVDLADVITSAVVQVDAQLELVASPLSELRRAAAAHGLPFVAEAFADRGYESNGELRSRSQEGALLTDYDSAAHQAMSLAESGVVVARDGALLAVPFQTLCLHGDMEGAAERIAHVQKRLAGRFRLTALARRRP